VEGSCVHQAGDYVVYGDYADGPEVVVEDGEHAEVVFVEEFEDVFFVGVGGDGYERIGFEFAHVLFGSGEENAGNGNGASEVAKFVDDDDGVELFEIEFLFAEPLEDFVAGDGFADEGKFGIHHAARGGGIESQKFANVIGFLIGHFFEQFFGRFFGEIGEEVGGGVRRHFFDDVGGFFGIEFLDDLRSETFVEFGEHGCRSFLVERGDDALAFCGGKLFHHFGEIGGVKIFELFVGDAKFYPAQRVGFDEIDEFPADGALREFALEFANEGRGSEALEQTANGAGDADIDLGNAEFDVLVGGEFGEVNVVDADDFAASGVDDLLVEEIFLYGEPGFVGLVGVEGALGDVEIEAAGKDFGDLVVAGDERLEASARDEEVRDAVGLVGRLDEEFTDTADIGGGGVVGGGAHEFGGVEHVGLVGPFCRGRRRDEAFGIASNLETNWSG
jgi:hypothetical protein